MLGERVGFGFDQSHDLSVQEQCWGMLGERPQELRVSL
uniref:Uncharacterized protein n=1 Tax=Anguilla anguilla TaxID=7936 RepID=A0A0E9P5Q8_ANGAN